MAKTTFYIAKTEQTCYLKIKRIIWKFVIKSVLKLQKTKRVRACRLIPINLKQPDFTLSMNCRSICLVAPMPSMHTRCLNFYILSAVMPRRSSKTESISLKKANLFSFRPLSIISFKSTPRQTTSDMTFFLTSILSRKKICLGFSMMHR